ncbi:FHA domain-containing protein [Nocardia sp. NBC_00508]|uniref:FHA domain-containing protein n=1 Tax=Nocardia sp. NBC_00508 TaxID=2975992 RepID=UPI002E802D65|nr:FHA domain-containing protein [Nocardia sp. NBC_00508]WUD66505.1 FHA domain-containing protein [Nocardia sp. NBC_00508]
MSGQIEVVPGSHVVASASGAVVVVAHRADGPVTADGVAARTTAALLDIVREAVARDRRRSGRAVARLATTWLMNLPDGEEDEVEFGVITPVEDGVAVFLHGGVTAILGDPERTEVLRGRDAGFTVDRVVTPGPGIGAALFVDEAGHSVGSLPGHGIFALGEGTAPGSGAVLWATAQARSVSQPPPGAPPDTAAEARATSKPDPVAGRPIAEPAAEVTSHESSAPHLVSEQQPRPTATPFSEPEAVSAPHGAEPVLDARSAVPPDARSAVPPDARPGPEQAAGPPPRRMPSLRKDESGDDATEVDLQARASGAGVTPPVAQPVLPQPERGGPRPERSGPDHAIATDANLAETVAPSAEVVADARGSAGANTLGHRVIVPGFQCARHHHNDPRVSFCAVCGIRMDQLTCVLTEGVRPPLGVLLLDDGTSFVLDNDCVLGREPEYAEAVGCGARPVRLEDSSGGMSRAHAEIRLIDWDVTVIDGGSTNGTHIRQPGHQEWIRAIPGHPVTLLPGAQIQLGGRVLTFDSPHGQL